MKESKFVTARKELPIEALDNSVFVAKAAWRLLAKEDILCKDAHVRHHGGVEKITLGDDETMLEFVRRIALKPSLDIACIEVGDVKEKVIVEIPIRGKVSLTYEPDVLRQEILDLIERELVEIPDATSPIRQSSSQMDLEVGRANVDVAKPRFNRRSGYIDLSAVVADGSSAIAATQAALEYAIISTKAEMGSNPVCFDLKFDGKPRTRDQEMRWQDWMESFVELLCESSHSFETEACLHARYDWAPGNRRETSVKKLISIAGTPEIEVVRAFIDAPSSDKLHPRMRLEGGLEDFEAKDVIRLVGKSRVIERLGIVATHRKMRFQAHLLPKRNLLSIVTPRDAAQLEVLTLCRDIARHSKL